MSIRASDLNNNIYVAKQLALTVSSGAAKVEVPPPLEKPPFVSVVMSAAALGSILSAAP